MNLPDDIRLKYCKKHKEWWVNNCPDCMAESVDEEWIKKLEDIIKPVRERNATQIKY
jgi:hypothetical protein